MQAIDTVDNKGETMPETAKHLHHLKPAHEDEKNEAAT
jgi:hypothetical protein